MVGTFSLVCLVALSHAPQFVAFDHALPANDSGPAYSVAVSPSDVQSSSQTAAVIPTALRTSAPLSGKTIAKAVRARAAARESASVPLVDAQVPEASAPERVVNVSASADREIAPQFQTLVFIQATQYVTSDVSVWSVQVWRVTLFGPALTPAQKRWLSVPVAHSI